MDRTPLRDGVAVQLDFDPILWRFDVVRFSNNTLSRLDTSLCHKKKILVGCALVKSGINLTFQSLAVSLRTIRFNILKFYMALALR